MTRDARNSPFSGEVLQPGNQYVESSPPLSLPLPHLDRASPPPSPSLSPPWYDAKTKKKKRIGGFFYIARTALGSVRCSDTHYSCSLQAAFAQKQKTNKRTAEVEPSPTAQAQRTHTVEVQLRT